MKEEELKTKKNVATEVPITADPESLIAQIIGSLCQEYVKEHPGELHETLPESIVYEEDLVSTKILCDDTKTEATTTGTTTTEPVIVNSTKFEPTEQYDANGRPIEEPIPREFLPPTPELIDGEPWQNDIVSQEEFDAVAHTMALPPFPEEGPQSLVAPHVPENLVELSIGYIVYMTTKKAATSYSAAQKKTAAMSQTARAFYERFGVYATDSANRLVNWRTVFLVAHLMRRLPTADAYDIDDDLFSGTQGMSEYNLDNWHAKKDHAIRMIVISQLSGDNVEAVYTLDLLMRFRRSMTRATHCVTFHDMGIKKAARNQSLCFVSFLNDADELHTSWLSVGLDDDVVKKMPISRSAPYHDGPYCNTCKSHHISLMYCTKCYCVQYCSMRCLKDDKRLHTKLCLRNSSGGK